MLALARKSAVPRIISRSFAQVVNASPSVDSSKPVNIFSKGLMTGRVPVHENHGLYAFFRRKEGEGLAGDARFDTVETPEAMQKLPSGRAWKASELRIKSFQDLHVLWYVLLRERNLLATQKEEARRMGIPHTNMQVSTTRVHNCRKSMARIKAVLNERRLAYEGAVSLIEKEQQVEEDQAVLKQQTKMFKKERSRLLRRREVQQREREAQQQAELEAEKQVAAAEQATPPPDTPSTTVSESIEQAEVEASVPKSEPPSKAPEQPPASEPAYAQPSTAPLPSPVNTATAGLFGIDRKISK